MSFRTREYQPLALRKTKRSSRSVCQPRKLIKKGGNEFASDSLPIPPDPLMNGKSKKASYSPGLTFDSQGQRVALALSLGVGGQASVNAGSLAIDPLQHQALVTHDDAGSAVLLHGSSLYGNIDTIRDIRSSRIDMDMFSTLGRVYPMLMEYALYISRLSPPLSLYVRWAIVDNSSVLFVYACSRDTWSFITVVSQPSTLNLVWH